jgi:hypothetical protein
LGAASLAGHPRAAAFGAALAYNLERADGGAELAGSTLREKFGRLRADLAAYRDAEDAYAKALGKFLGWPTDRDNADRVGRRHSGLLRR